MSTPIHAEYSGTFTTPATLVPVSIPVPCGCDYIEVLNLTEFASSAADTNIVRAVGYSFLPAGSALYNAKTTGAATMAIATMTASGGFTFVSDSGSQTPGTAVALNGSFITQATPALVYAATTPTTGQIVRLYGTTGMLQVAGYDFTVGTVSASTYFQAAFLPAAGFAAAATAGYYEVIPYDARFYPRRRYITAITAANPAVVTLSVSSGFVAGEQVRMIVPSQFGMTQMNNVLATITSVTNTASTNTITLNVDASAFTAFSFPTSAIAATGVTPAMVVPVGEAAINTSTYPYAGLLDDATQNQSFAGITIGTGILTASCSYAYIARRGIAL